jgi:hypothetical protein
MTQTTSRHWQPPPAEFSVVIRGEAAECLKRLAFIQGYNTYTTHDPIPALERALKEAWERVPADHPLRWTEHQKQIAHGRVSNQVRSGKRPHAKAFPCVDCGHVWREGERNGHEYDHHLGYDDEHSRDVEPVCGACHRRRTAARHKKHGVYR